MALGNPAGLGCGKYINRVNTYCTFIISCAISVRISAGLAQLGKGAGGIRKIGPIATHFLSLSRAARGLWCSCAHHCGQSTAGYSYLLLWLPNRIAFESCSEQWPSGHQSVPIHLRRVNHILCAATSIEKSKVRFTRDSSLAS